MSRHARHGRRGASPELVPVLLGLWLGGLVAVLVAGVVLLLPTGGSGTAATAAPSAPVVQQHLAPAAGRDATPAPTAVDIPSTGSRSSLVPTSLKADRTIAVPSTKTPEQAAWYTGAPRPGAVGPAIVVGHVNGGGRDGVFADLADVKQGAEVLVTRADRSVAVFTVTRIDTVAKNAFPTRAVYGDTPGPELRLITCGGDYDAAAHSYESNVVVHARLASVRAAPAP